MVVKTYKCWFKKIEHTKERLGGLREQAQWTKREKNEQTSHV